MDARILFNFILNTLIDECQPKETKRNKRKKSMKKKLLCSFKIRRKVPKNEGFLSVIPTFPEDIFKSHFRMSKSTFEKLCSKLEPFWRKPCIGRPAINLRVALYVTVWKLTNNCSFRDVSDRFNLARGTSHAVVDKTTQFLTRHRKKTIKWPTTSCEFNKKIDEFQNLRRYPFPFVVGCLDGTHIEIPSPGKNSDSYYNRKGTHSIILQVVCDANCAFLDVYFGYPGRSHDAAVWRSSPLSKALQSGKVVIPQGAHLLGDSAYPLTSLLMVPFKDNGYLDDSQKKFNMCLSSTRVCIEQALGILKNKFRILKYMEIRDLKKAKYIVMSCVILHNHIIECGGIDTIQDTSNMNYVTIECTEAACDEDNLENVFVEDNARDKRNGIVALISG